MKTVEVEGDESCSGKKQIRLEEMMKTVEVEGDESCSGANETNDVEEVGESDEKGIAGEEDDTSNSESESDEPSNQRRTGD